MGVRNVAEIDCPLRTGV